MAGVKGRSGNRKGNTTERRGKKFRRQIELTQAASERLRRIWRARSLAEPGLTEDEIANAAILALPEPGPAEEWDGGVL
jgi:hypothetical protein